MLLVERRFFAAHFSNLTRQANMSQKSVKKGGLLRNVENINPATAFFASTVDYIPEALIAIDHDWKVIGWNLAAERIYGWTAGEVMGKPLNDFLKTVYTEGHTSNSAASTAMESGGWSGEVTQLRKDGIRIPIWSTVSAVMDKEGAVIGLIGINHDISEQKRAGEKIRESEGRFRDTFEQMLEGIQIFDFDWRYLYLNPAAERHNRRPNSELLGNIYMDMWRGIETTPVFSNLKRCMEERIPSHVENEFEYPDGSVGWFELNIRPIQEGIFILSVDITERKQAEQILRQKESILSTAEEVAQIGSWRWDLRTQKVTWSDEMFRLFGVEREGFDGDVNRVVSERIHPDDAAAVFESNRSVLEDETPLPLSYRIVLPDGAERAVWAQGEILRNESGQPIALTGYVQDITERVKAERKILQMKRLYATLSQVNQTIVRVKDSTELYQSICDVAVKFGELSAAWIGLLDEESGELRPTAANGLDVKNWTLPVINIHGGSYENLVVVEALRTSNSVTSEDVQTDERTKSLREKLKKTNFHSLASIPFRLRGKTIGVLNLLSSEVGFFKAQEEILLLNEMGLDISFALDNMENEKLKRQWADAFEHCAHGIAIGLPSVNIILTCNSAFARQQGRTVEEVSSTPILAQYMPQDHEQVKQAISLADRAGHAQYNARMVRKDGSIYPVQMDVVSVRDENGVLLYRVATQQDITARKQAEEALLQSEKQYRLLFENNPLPMWTYDVQTLKFITVNDAAIQKYGYTRDEFLSMMITDLRLPEDVERFINMKPRSRAVLMHSGEWRHRLKDGAVIDVEVLSHVFLKGHETVLVVALDITARKRAEKALRESEERYRLISENAADVIWILDPIAGKFTYVSPSVQKLRGYTPQEVMAQPVSEALTPESLELVSKGLAEHLPPFIQRGQGTLTNTAEVDQPRKDGSIVHTEVTTTYLFNSRGQVEIVGVTRDISERKQAESILRRNERVLRLFVEHSPAAIAMFDTDMKYIVASRRYLVDYGLGEQDLTGRSHYEVFPEIPERWKEIHRRCLADAIERADDDPFPRADGHMDWVHWEIHPWYEDTGKIGGVILFSEVVTERRQAQEALFAANEKYRNIFDNAVEAITQTTPDGKYISANLATARMLGYDSTEDLIASVSSVERQFYVMPDRREEFIRLMKQNGSVSDFESEVYRKDGSRIWVSENSHSVYDKQGSLLYYEGAGQDITRRKLAEMEIQRRTEDLLLINLLNDAANRGGDIASITELFAREARSIFGCQAAAVYLLSSDGKYLEMQSNTLPRKLTERIEKLIGRSIPKIQIPLRGDGYFRRILQSEQGLIASDPAVIQGWIEEFTDTNFLPMAFRSAIRKLIPQIYRTLNIGSTISIPLINAGQAFGVLDMSSTGQFTEDDLQRIRTISYQVTAVILRKQAEERVQLQFERMRALSEIDRAISSSLDMRLSLDILLNQVLSQLGVDAADVLLLNPSSQTLEYEAGKGFRSLAIRESRQLLGQGFAGKAGLDRKLVHIPDIAAAGDPFLRAALLKDEDFLEYFGVPLVAKGMLKGVLEVFHRAPLNPDVEWVNYLEVLGGQAAIAIDNAQLFEAMQKSNLELVTAYDATIVGWSRAMDLRDKETEGHTQRVTELAVQLAKKMGMNQYDIVQLRRGALLHDIGKLGVPDQILHKPDKLDRLEWAVMRQHPAYAFNMLMSIHYLRPALDIPYCHHEKWDGSGYPRGLKGMEIPLAARIFAVVDVWDALRSDRPYREGWTAERVHEHIVEEAGKHFDPQVVKAFLELLNEFPELF